MNIQEINKLLDDMNEKNPEELLSPEMTARCDELGEQLSKNYDAAQELISRTLSEESLMKLMYMLQKSVCSSCLDEGLMFVVMADQSGQLITYTQNVILNMIGTLYKEGVL